MVLSLADPPGLQLRATGPALPWGKRRQAHAREDSSVSLAGGGVEWPPLPLASSGGAPAASGVCVCQHRASPQPRRQRDWLQPGHAMCIWDHLKQCFGRPSAEARDTDVLVQEANGSFSSESPSLEGSVAPAQKPSPGCRASLYSSQRGPAAAADRRASSGEQRSRSLDDSSPDADSASPPTEKAGPDFSFLEQTPQLDSRVLKSRVLLGKRRQQHRAPISHTLRRGIASGDAQRAPISAVEGPASTWMFRDSTEEKPPRAGEEEDEEESPPAERLFPAQPRLPLFPGLAPSALKAQLRKRHESEGRREEAPPAPLCKSPKGLPLARGSGGRALAATPEKEGRPEELPPAWLTELKSRRKQDQPESPI